MGRVGRTLFTLVLCLHFTLSYMSERLFLRLPDYMAGHERLPYQSRILPMLLMDGAARVHGLGSVASHVPFGDHTLPTFVMGLLAFFGMLGAVYATRGTILALTGDRSAARWICLLVVLMSYFNLAPNWGLNYSLPYDVPSLCFFAVGIWLIVTGRIVWFYPVFILATLNRETACFLILFYSMWSVGRARETGAPLNLVPIALNSAAFSVIWLALKVFLMRRYHGNPADGNGVFAQHIVQNLKFLMPHQWPVLLSVCGFTIPLMLMARRWIRSPAYTLAAGSVMVLWFACMMIVGVLIEIRIFAEWAAMVTPFLALILHHRLTARTGSTI